MLPQQRTAFRNPDANKLHTQLIRYIYVYKEEDVPKMGSALDTIFFELKDKREAFEESSINGYSHLADIINIPRYVIRDTNAARNRTLFMLRVFFDRVQIPSAIKYNLISRCHFGENILHLAVDRGDLEVLNFILFELKKALDRKIISIKDLLNLFNDQTHHFANTVLHEAAATSKFPIVQAIIEFLLKAFPDTSGPEVVKALLQKQNNYGKVPRCYIRNNPEQQKLINEYLDGTRGVTASTSDEYFRQNLELVTAKREFSERLNEFDQKEQLLVQQLNELQVELESERELLVGAGAEAVELRAQKEDLKQKYDGLRGNYFQLEEEHRELDSKYKASLETQRALEIEAAAMDKQRIATLEKKVQELEAKLAKGKYKSKKESAHHHHHRFYKPDDSDSESESKDRRDASPRKHKSHKDKHHRRR